MNIIKNHAVVSKQPITIPLSVEGVLKCLNEMCITNNEPISTKFVITKKPLKAKCFYCEREFGENSIKKML